MGQKSVTYYLNYPKEHHWSTLREKKGETFDMKLTHTLQKDTIF
jgi:hypothetical protein